MEIGVSTVLGKGLWKARRAAACPAEPCAAILYTVCNVRFQQGRSLSELLSELRGLAGGSKSISCARDCSSLACYSSRTVECTTSKQFLYG